jgi:hypothetical protein
VFNKLRIKPYHNITGFFDLHEDMRRVLLWSDDKASFTDVIVGTICAFLNELSQIQGKGRSLEKSYISISSNLGVAEITSSIMQRLVGSPTDGVNYNATWFRELDEFMQRMESTSLSRRR